MENLDSFPNSITDRSTTSRRAVGIEFHECSSERIVVDREWALHNRFSGKCNQSDAFAVQSIDERTHIRLCSFQPGWNDVVGQHRARNIDQHIEITAARNDLFDLRPKSWTSESDQACGECDFKQQKFAPEAKAGRCRKNATLHRSGDECFSCSLSTFF